MDKEQFQVSMDKVDRIRANRPDVKERTENGLCCHWVITGKRKGRFCSNPATHKDRFGVAYCTRHGNGMNH